MIASRMHPCNVIREFVVHEEITSRDVLLGRRKSVYQHAGNLAYRKLVRAKSLQYKAQQGIHKDAVASELIATIQNQGGRFLRQIEGGYYWEKCPNTIVRAKVKQALRDHLKVATIASTSPSDPPNGSPTGSIAECPTEETSFLTIDGEMPKDTSCDRFRYGNENIAFEEPTSRGTVEPSAHQLVGEVELLDSTSSVPGQMLPLEERFSFLRERMSRFPAAQSRSGLSSVIPTPIIASYAAEIAWLHNQLHQEYQRRRNQKHEDLMEDIETLELLSRSNQG